MKNFLLLIILGLFFFQVNAQQSDKIFVDEFLATESVDVFKPAFSDVENVNGDLFTDKDLITFPYMQDYNFRPQKGDRLEWTDLGLLKWRNTSVKENQSINIKAYDSDYQMAFVAFYLQNDEWANLDLEFTSGQMLEVFIDGEKKDGKYTWEKQGEEKKLSFNCQLSANNHVVLIKTLYSKKESNIWSLSCSIDIKNDLNTVKLTNSLDSYSYMDINHLMNGVNIQTTKISADGDYYFVTYKMTNKDGKSHVITDVRAIADHLTMQLYHGSNAYDITWAPHGNVLTYLTKVGKKTWLWEYDMDNGRRFPLATDLGDITGYKWAPSGEYILLICQEKAKKSSSGLNKLESIEDHWPWYRNRVNLYMLDILSGIKTPITHGYLSNQLEDISYNGRFILFSQRIFDQTERPYTKQILMQYDKKTKKTDTIWNRFGASNVHYSPDNKQLLVLSGPSFFGKQGTNLTTSEIPNDYDGQAYLYTLKDGSVKTISKSFNPSINRAVWNSSDANHIYFSVAERTYVGVYQYSINSDEYTSLNLDMDVVNSIDFSTKKPLIVFYGSSISTPKKAYMKNITTGEIVQLDYPEEKFFENVEFGSTEDWNFTNKKGVTIEGRLYYPPNFDPTKKYPMIVYYYGGTSPTERSFRGRYPKNLFAAKGYLVYVLQPSGATGYGQDFSAEHINNWGKTVAEEIIQGTKELCQSYTYIDSTKVGCMGASYGGFMTMYLITQSDFFSAAISHAGISSISSYWGEGHWGYLYSQVASANSFPWNNKDLYVDQSPLFNADKVNTPILLLHGKSDTNVPPGESRQFYTALKLLNKDVELIEIDNQNHHIVDYRKRIMWQETILAWFDKNLKKQPDWWFQLYPKKKL